MSGIPGTGASFGRYALERELGRGGMGVVYAARDTTLQRPVAVKILHPTMAADAEYRDRFAREAATLARMDSPYILQIFDYGERDGCLFLVTQLVTGGDLHQWLREHGPLDTAEALAVTHDLCEALVDAHAAGVVHRDVKPSNVFLRTRGGRLTGLLGDFGIATSVDGQLTKTGAVVGSTAYMAPERHQGTRADERGDIYSVGCVLWMCLTGRPPYSGTDVQIAMAHLSDPVQQLSDGRPGQGGLNAVLARTLAKDPDERFASVAELAAALRALAHPSAGDTPPEVPPAAAAGVAPDATALRPAAAPAPPPPADHRFPLLAGAVAALVVLAAVVGFVILRGGSDDPAATTDAAFRTQLYAGLQRVQGGWELPRTTARCVGDGLLQRFGEQGLQDLGVVDKTGLVALHPRLDGTQADDYATSWVGCGATARWAWAGYLHRDGKALDQPTAEGCVAKGVTRDAATTWIAAYVTDTTPPTFKRTGRVVQTCVQRATN